MESDRGVRVGRGFSITLGTGLPLPDEVRSKLVDGLQRDDDPWAQLEVLKFALGENSKLMF